VFASTEQITPIFRQLTRENARLWGYVEVFRGRAGLVGVAATDIRRTTVSILRIALETRF